MSIKKPVQYNSLAFFMNKVLKCITQVSLKIDVVKFLTLEIIYQNCGGVNFQFELFNN